MEPGLYWVQPRGSAGFSKVTFHGTQHLEGTLAAVLPSECTTVELEVQPLASIVVRVTLPAAEEESGTGEASKAAWTESDICLARPLDYALRSFQGNAVRGDSVEFDDLKYGPYELKPDSNGAWTFEPMTIELEAGERRVVDVQLERRRTAALPLRVVDGTGRVLPLRLYYEIWQTEVLPGGEIEPRIFGRSRSGFVGAEDRIVLPHAGTYLLEHRLARSAPGRSFGLAPHDVVGAERTIVVHEDWSVTPEVVEITLEPKGTLCELIGVFTGSDDGPASQYAIEYSLTDGTRELLPLRPTKWPHFSAVLDLGRLADPTARLVDENRPDNGPLGDISLIAPRTDWTVDLGR
ncbi:MAG: hypothetical protein AAFP86_03865 [Planctomycetota bacterium]